MLVERNECCDCATGAYPCLGESCGRRHTPHLVCDRCGYDDVDLLYMLGSEQLCRSCVEKYAPALLPETLYTVTIDNNEDAVEQPPEYAEEPDRWNRFCG